MTWGQGKRLVLASDHAAVQLRQDLARAAESWGFSVEDLGPDSTESIDYPAQAIALASALDGDEAAFGVLVCGTGIGMSMAANRFSHVRAAAVSDGFSAQACRAHNNANVICMGARTLGPGLAQELLRIFLSSDFEGGRHQRRVDLFPAGASPRDP